jgi:ornithine cyclodeaminase/alanine dehydrogenase-like protein (mu-crystallin family)
MSLVYPGFNMIACSTPAEMIEGADVVVTAIPIVTEPKPPLHAGMLKKGGLAISLDYDSAWTRSAMKGCDKFVSDDIGQLLSTKEEGIYFGGIPENIYADLGELAAGLKPGREGPKERIFSMNMGIAVDDMVTAKIVYERALERGMGTKLQL